MTDGSDDVPVFDVLESGVTVDQEGRRFPTAVIDASGVPAVADLARVHAVEGVGDITTAAVRAGDDVVVLGIRVTVPVTAAFALVVDLRRHRQLLDDVVSTGSLAIAHTDPTRAADDEPQWLAIDIDGDALADRIGPW